MSEYDDALVFVNQLFDHMTGLARAIVDDCEDGKVSWFEGADLALKAVQMTQDVITLTASASAELRAQIPYVLEHGHWDLDSQG